MRTIRTKFALALLLHAFFFSAVILGNPIKNDNKTARMRTELMKLGVGEQAKIEVKLKDGSKVKGYLREVKEHDFVVMDEATNAEVAIPYPQVQKAKGHNLNGGVKILLTVGIALFVCVLWAIAAGRSS